MSSSKRESREDDVVEMKKALATGNVKQDSPASNSMNKVSILSLGDYFTPRRAECSVSRIAQFVVSGKQFNMNFLLLGIQSTVCVACVSLVKKLGIISFRSFDMKDAKAWFPISFLLVSVIYTGSKSLQYLSIPVYTIFKNLTIILIAYGEVIWFGGRVTGLTLISFFFMVLSSVIAAWADIGDALAAGDPAVIEGSSWGLSTMTGVVSKLNVGYFWMLVLAMRKRIKVTGFSDWDSMFYNNLLSIPVLAVFSLIVENWSHTNLVHNFPEETRNFLLFAIAFSGAAAVGISYTTAWCVRVTSSTTYSMVGALNKLPVAASGMIFFGDAVTVGSVSAVGVGFFAGLVYAIAKNNQKKAEAANQSPGVLPLTRKP
ncbi:hypothetical protein NLI96_g8372 [Meripilus lineatus]|uniref:GDP-mannose transporter n=1 Tax=Meripilus lineatus TaxID=2056292 RepID=A0AAD5YGC5_9APHY|nr:hypothetical protein NLI96_g8372 [Physisporinus lineatus]